jgi:hypothetical protein
MAIYKLIKMYQTALQEVENSKPKTWCGKYFKEVKICNINKRLSVLRKEAEALKSHKPEYK